MTTTVPLAALSLALLAVPAPATPVAPAVQQAVEARLARLAVEMRPGSLERADGPACPPYRLFTFLDGGAGQRRGVAVAEDGEVVVAGDAAALGKLLLATRLLDRLGPQGALELWRLLHQAGPLLDAPAIAALPQEDRPSVAPAHLEPREGGQRVVGFVRQGEEIFRVQLDLVAGRAEVSLRTLGEVQGRDEVDEAVRALRSADEVVRAAALFELGAKDDPRAHAAALGALRDASGEVRGMAAQALRQQAAAAPARKAGALAALRQALAREQDAAVRRGLEEVLAALESKPAPRRVR